MVHNLYSKIISPDNLFNAYREFRKGKRARQEVTGFEINLEDNIFSLCDKLTTKKYFHNSYHQFKICDPKPRIIHKAAIKDRIVHQAVYRILNPIFDKSFIFDSYSSRLGKGTHRAVKRLRDFARKISGTWKKLKNYREKFPEIIK